MASLLSNRASWAVITVAVPTTFLVLLKVSLSRHVTTSFDSRAPSTSSAPSSSSSASKDEAIQDDEEEPTTARFPVSLPAEVTSPTSDFILSHECVTWQPLRAAALRAQLPLLGSADTTALRELLTAYSRATMEAFSWTPQAWAIRAAIRDPAERQSFTREWIESREMKVGDVLNGAYKVSHRGVEEDKDGGGGGGGGVREQRIEFMLAPPQSYTGPVVHGIVVSGMRVTGRGSAGDSKDEKTGVKDEARNEEQEEEKVVFFNETWMWRRRGDKKTMLEGPVGRWFHSLLAAWLISKGVTAVRCC